MNQQALYFGQLVIGPAGSGKVHLRFLNNFRKYIYNLVDILQNYSGHG